jgi:16S rRNA (cytosine967-C5)-methyltransferase
MSVSPARVAAYEILLRVERDDSYASELLHSARLAELTPTDHGLATQLVMGVLRWRSLLDFTIAKVSSQRLEKLDDEVLTALRLGAYQLGWLDRIPARAAIHESVELVKRARKRSAAAFANAVLRKLAEFPRAGATQIGAIESATTADVLARASAHPGWLVRGWVSQFGLEIARKVCGYHQSIPITTLRTRTSSAEKELAEVGIELKAGAFLVHARHVLAGNITNTQALQEGRVAIQDEASQLVAALVGRGERILDCCAAPGGKTVAIADRNPDARIVAAELHPHRAALLRRRVAASNIEVITTDVCDLSVGGRFDVVLVDAPCSGTGTLARNPEIKWRLKANDPTDLRSRQVSIVSAAMKHVADRGKLIYSTCSLEREENESVVEDALRSNESFQLFDIRGELERLRASGEWVGGDFESVLQGYCLRTLPGVHPCDGFFVAMLKRK